MTTLRERGAALLGRALKTHASTAVTFRRRNQSVSVSATLKMLDYEVTSDDGTPTMVRFFDWVITKADLAGFTPQRGDELTATIGGEATTLFVAPIDNMPEVMSHDAAGTQIVVHTKRL